jgi:hypothetical protein
MTDYNHIEKVLTQMLVGKRYEYCAYECEQTPVRTRIESIAAGPNNRSSSMITVVVEVNYPQRVHNLYKWPDLDSWIKEETRTELEKWWLPMFAELRPADTYIEIIIDN